MSAALGHGRRWAISAGGAAALTVLALLVLQTLKLPAIEAPVRAKPTPIELTRVNPQVNKAALLHDQIALFLPTERNVTMKPVARMEAGQGLLQHDTGRPMPFGDAELTLHLPPPVVVAAKPETVILDDAAPTPLLGFGRIDSREPALPSRGAVVEVRSNRTNQRVQLWFLPPEARPPGAKAWRPMEFVARIEAAGLVGALAIAEHSDVEEAEIFFRNYLAQTYRIGERLPPGIYRIAVGP